MFKSLVVASSLALSAVSAQAASVTFDFTSPGDDNVEVGNTLVFTDAISGLGVTARALQEGGGFFVFARNLVTDAEGIGVTTNNDGVVNGDPGQLDGDGSSAEGILLDFTEAVRIEQITFGAIGGNDDGSIFADFANDGSSLFSEQEANLDLADNDPYISTFSALVDRLIFGAPGDNDDYYLASITVSQVPVPAAGFLFGSAIGLAGLWRKRKGLQLSGA